MTVEKEKLKKIPFDVHIPNLDGDGTAEIIPIEVQAYADPETGEDVLTPESLDLIERTQARHMGLMTAEDVKALRTRLALSQDEMSDLLQIGAKTYTRWESGRARPSRSMNVMLCALRDGQLGINYLRALRNPELQAAWSTKEARRALAALIFARLEVPQTEFKFPALSAFRQGSQSTLPIWQHLWETHWQTSVMPDYSATLVKAVHAAWAEEDKPTLSAPRLPSCREQRQSFMSQRFDPYSTEETVSG
jgi:DNA-binding transcriptional regulator YiaG